MKARLGVVKVRQPTDMEVMQAITAIQMNVKLCPKCGKCTPDRNMGLLLFKPEIECADCVATIECETCMKYKTLYCCMECIARMAIVENQRHHFLANPGSVPNLVSLFEWRRRWTEISLN